jgi:hypothetical protein
LDKKLIVGVIIVGFIAVLVYSSSQNNSGNSISNISNPILYSDTITENDCESDTSMLNIYRDQPPSIKVQIHPEIIICTNESNWHTGSWNTDNGDGRLLYLLSDEFEYPITSEKLDSALVIGTHDYDFYYIDYNNQIVEKRNQYPVPQLQSWLSNP